MRFSGRPVLLIFNTAPASRRCFAPLKSEILSTKRPIALSPTNQGHNDNGRLRKASGCGPKALYGMPGVQRDLMLGRTPTSSRLQAFRIQARKGLTKSGLFQVLLCLATQFLNSPRQNFSFDCQQSARSLPQWTLIHETICIVEFAILRSALGLNPAPRPS